MKKIYLVRHAQSQSNAGLIISPNHQIALTDLGTVQAYQLGDWLLGYIDEPVTDVLVSSYLRTQETAKPYLTALNIAQPSVFDELREFNYLDFEHIKDVSFAKLVQMSQAFWQQGDILYQDSLQTDSFASFVQRVQKMRQQFETLTDGVYVVFTHGMWIGMLLWQILHGDGKRVLDMHRFREFEMAIRPKNCEVYRLDLPSYGITKVRTIGD